MKYQLFPPLIPERYEALKSSIEEVGMLYPIICDEEGNIVDGFHRKKICDELGIECPSEIKQFESEAQKVEYSLRANCERRQLNSQQKRELVKAYIKLDPELSSRALCKITGVSDKTITKIRKELVATAEIPQLENFRGLDGKRRRLPTIVVNSAKEAEQAVQVIGELPPSDKTFDIVTANRIAKRQIRRNGLAVPAPKVRCEQLDQPHSAEVTCGDCIEVMKQFESQSISVVVTSPPYNLDVSYATYIDNRPEDEYLDWLAKVFKAIHRVLRDDGSFFLNVGGSRKKPWTAMRVAEVAGRIFQLQNEIVWVKSISLNGRTQGHFQPLSGDRFLNHNFEQVFHFTKSGDVKLDRLAIGVEYEDPTNLLRNNATENRRCGGDVWFLPYKTVTDASQRGQHPATFPVELPERCIKLHGVKEGCVVLDPFCGTGSTLLAAERLGVKSIGIDADSSYCDHAERRLRDARSQFGRNIDCVFYEPCQQTMARLPDDFIDLVISSPPYFGCRKYTDLSDAEELGREADPRDYLSHLVEVFAEIKRVLKPTGSFYLVIGDVYFGTKGFSRNSGNYKRQTDIHYNRQHELCAQDQKYIQNKQLLLLPSRVASAMQDEGWVLRNDIIWHKTNPLPNSASDRLMPAHEYIYHFVKKPQGYFYDFEKAKEIGWRYDVCKHSVTPFGDHKATFAEKVIEPLVLVSSKVGELVYDPFMGSGTTGVVAKKYGRRYLGSELVEKHVALCEANGLNVVRRDGTES